MSLKVLKFGGSSLADAIHFRQVADIVKAEPERRYVVASAPGKRSKEDIKVSLNLDSVLAAGTYNGNVTASTGKTPTYFGKPYAETVEMIGEATGFARDEMCIFGDRLYTDIAVAQNAGSVSVLVLSGETDQAMLDAAERKPDYVLPSVKELFGS